MVHQTINDTLGNDLLRDGWDCTKKPVLVDVEVGDIIDGRTRESTMKNLDTNEKWIPVLKVIVSPSLRRCVIRNQTITHTALEVYHQI